MKVLVNFSVEEHVAIAFKAFVPARERSSKIEHFMAAMAMQNSDVSQEEKQLTDEIESIQNQLHNLGKLLSEKVAMREMRRVTLEKEHKEHWKRMQVVSDTFVASSPLRDIDGI